MMEKVKSEKSELIDRRDKLNSEVEEIGDK